MPDDKIVIVVDFVPIPELNNTVYYLVLSDRLEGPYQDADCTVLLPLPEVS